MYYCSNTVFLMFTCRQGKKKPPFCQHRSGWFYHNLHLVAATVSPSSLPFFSPGMPNPSSCILYAHARNLFLALQLSLTWAACLSVFPVASAESRNDSWWSDKHLLIVEDKRISCTPIIIPHTKQGHVYPYALYELAIISSAMIISVAARQYLAPTFFSLFMDTSRLVALGIFSSYFLIVIGLFSLILFSLPLSRTRDGSKSKIFGALAVISLAHTWYCELQLWCVETSRSGIELW